MTTTQSPQTQKTEEETEMYKSLQEFKKMTELLNIERKKLEAEMKILPRTNKLVHLYEVKYKRIINNELIVWREKQIRDYEVYKKYIHLKINNELLQMAISGADEQIFKTNLELNELKDFIYDGYGEKIEMLNQSLVRHHFMGY
jgi:hypothetical protein